MEKSYVRKVSSRYCYEGNLELEIDVDRNSIEENDKKHELLEEEFCMMSWSLCVRITETKLGRLETTYSDVFYYSSRDMSQKKKIIEKVFPIIANLDCTERVKGDIRYKIDDAINMLVLDADKFFAQYHGEY